MDTLLLIWYARVDTGPVMILTGFASLQHIGKPLARKLLAPIPGGAGYRMGSTTTPCATRAACTALAALVPHGALNPAHLLRCYPVGRLGTACRETTKTI